MLQPDGTFSGTTRAGLTGSRHTRAYKVTGKFSGDTVSLTLQDSMCPPRSGTAHPTSQRQLKHSVTGSSQMLDIAKTTKLVDQCWSDEIVPTLVEYIKIPNKSPAFDPDWAAHGYMDEAVVLFER